ncbi:response regulator [Dictyobacter vulcani]|uniref:response regulator n=1 Tax=Dictyobacter vulcani TaxID=2607529 RepID=UPI001E4078A5|nr:response regulator transcription factor [Dictyobacter vulcani]
MRKVQLKNATCFPSPGIEIWSESNTVGHTAAPVPTGIQPVAVAHNPWIMVIDDSATVRKIVEICLTREGYEVVSFPDGIAAMRWLAEPQARIPSMIILDIGLPRMDGYEVACRLKTKPQLSQTIIIMLTRCDSTVDKLKCRLAGAKDYLVKPFQTQTLLSVVETHLGKPPLLGDH